MYSPHNEYNIKIKWKLLFLCCKLLCGLMKRNNFTWQYWISLRLAAIWVAHIKNMKACSFFLLIQFKLSVLKLFKFYLKTIVCFDCQYSKMRTRSQILYGITTEWWFTDMLYPIKNNSNLKLEASSVAKYKKKKTSGLGVANFVTQSCRILTVKFPLNKLFNSHLIILAFYSCKEGNHLTADMEIIFLWKVLDCFAYIIHCYISKILERNVRTFALASDSTYTQRTKYICWNFYRPEHRLWDVNKVNLITLQFVKEKAIHENINNLLTWLKNFTLTLGLSKYL